MNTSKHRVENLVRGELKSDSMTEEEAAAVWTILKAELASPPIAVQPPERRRPAKKKLVVSLTLGVAAILFALVALLPNWSNSGEDGLDIGSLESATASEVLAVTGREASRESLLPSKGEQLYFRSVRTSPTGAEDTQRIEEWIGPDGLGYRRDPTRGGSSKGSSSGSTETQPLTETFDASEGPDPRIVVSESWRAVLSMSQLEDLSDAPPPEALRQLRRSVSGAVGRAPDLSRGVHDFVGSDLIVLMTVTNLLTQAPLTGQQREGLFKLIETSPTWMKSDGTAPSRTTNLGESESQAGQSGILIQTSIDLPPTAAAILGVNPSFWRLDILLDPDAGTVLEVRNTQAGDKAPYSVTTTESLEIVR